MASYVTPGGAVWAVATRVTPLSANGSVAAGGNTFTTNTLVKATIAPATESGDDIAVKNAAGDLSVFAVHADIVKWLTVSLELTQPDPQLEQALVGGTVLNSTSTALGLPTGLAAAQNSGITGTLAAGTYGYRASQYNAFGESLAESEVTVTTTGTSGTVVLSGVTPAAGALGVRYYGRTPGGEQLLGQAVVIGSQTTTAASGTGTVTSLSVSALTAPIPSGYSFTLSGDTNSPKIVFTTTAAAGVGATALSVTASASITTTIASAATLQPVFVDTGSITPNGALPSTDYTAGPGNAVGYQAPAVGSVPTSVQQGVSLEFWMKRIINGYQATDYPYWRIVLPLVANMVIGSRDVTNANLATQAEGQAFQNPNWGSGPFGDWPFDSSKVVQRAISGSQVLPTAGVTPIPAAA